MRLLSCLLESTHWPTKVSGDVFCWLSDSNLESYRIVCVANVQTRAIQSVAMLFTLKWNFFSYCHVRKHMHKSNIKRRHALYIEVYRFLML